MQQLNRLFCEPCRYSALCCKMLSEARFSIFLLTIQVIFIVLYGVFVDYDVAAGPKTNQSSDVEVKEFQALYPMFQDVHVMIFAGFGFLMTFLKKYSYGAVGFNLLLAAFVIQWAILMRGSFHAMTNGIHVNVDTIMNADFAAGAVLISFGAVLGVLSPFQLLIMALLEVVFYAVNEWILVEHLGVNDIGGSLIIHTFGAYFGLAVSIMHWRKELKKNPKEGSVYHSDIFAMIGTLFLWIFWPSFNGALAASNPSIAQRCITNTLYSIIGSAMASFAISSVINKENKLDMVHIQNSTLAGGVAAGAVANLYISPMGAMIIGTTAGILSVVGYKYITPALMRAIKLHDTCGVHNLHGMPGILSGFVAVVAARLTTASTIPDHELSEIYPHSVDGNFQQQANMQMAGLVVTLAVAVGGGISTGLILRAPLITATKSEDLFDDTKYWIIEDEDQEEKENESVNENLIPLTSVENEPQAVEE